MGARAQNSGPVQGGMPRVPVGLMGAIGDPGSGKAEASFRTKGLGPLAPPEQAPISRGRGAWEPFFELQVSSFQTLLVV